MHGNVLFTLSRYFDAVADAHGLVVGEDLAHVLAKPFVAEILEV